MIKVLQAAAVLTVVFSFATGLDIRHHSVELFSHFRLQYFAVSLLLLIAFAFLMHYAWAAALLVTVFFNASFVLPWYVSDAPTATGTPLKLMHANVYSGNRQYDRLLALVELEKPDLVFLQEVTPEWLAGTQPLLEGYPYTYAEPSTGNFGIAVFSRIPFSEVRHVASPPLGYPTLIATVMVDAEPLTVISSHPTIPMGGPLYEARNDQLQSVADLVREERGKLVLLGDFNASTWDRHFRQLEVSTGLMSVRRGFGVLPTWPTFLPFAMIPIDHALVSDGISVVDARTGTRIGSDHLPLIVTLAL
ncbi:MAG: endonuclease/exonuclease/phosphatase family protein [Gammaproteobacteria bacterium]|nr:endonuclease/exonuclease/phosphatase family protein [Gammaproteobacteria bacterium]